MKSHIAVVFIVGICALATVCSQTPGISVDPAVPGVNGADGSTGNDLSRQYCAQNEDPGQDMGSP